MLSVAGDCPHHPAHHGSCSSCSLFSAMVALLWSMLIYLTKFYDAKFLQYVLALRLNLQTALILFPAVIPITCDWKGLGKRTTHLLLQGLRPTSDSLWSSEASIAYQVVSSLLISTCIQSLLQGASVIQDFLPGGGGGLAVAKFQPSVSV